MLIKSTHDRMTKLPQQPRRMWPPTPAVMPSPTTRPRSGLLRRAASSLASDIGPSSRRRDFRLVQPAVQPETPFVAAMTIAPPPQRIPVEVGAVVAAEVAEEAEEVVAEAVVAEAAVMTGSRFRAIPIHPSRYPRIRLATGRRGPMDRSNCRTWPVARS
jgi:hypothetical protein